MKTDRFSTASIRKAGVLLIALFLASGLSAAGGKLQIGRLTIGFDSPSKKLAEALAPQVQVVQTRFDENRRALRTVQGSDGKPAFLRKDVASLITQTGGDLDTAIEKVQPSDLAPLRAWSDDAVAHIQTELGALPGPKTAVFSSDPFTPRGFAVFASLSSPPKHAKPKHASPKPVAPKAVAPTPDSVPTDKSNSLLDEVGEVVSRIFVLASNDDLEVKLWVGSTPATKATFSFQSQGKIQGSTPASSIVQTNGKKDHVVRGLYAYKAVWGLGAVAQTIPYPTPVDAPAGQIPSERLDLVKGTSFFCCQFKEGYCRHVANEKECRP
jgi:hypothetical protein